MERCTTRGDKQLGVCRADGYCIPKIGRQQGRLAYLPDVTLLDRVVLVEGGVTTHSAPSDGVQSTNGGARLVDVRHRGVDRAPGARAEVQDVGD